MKRPGFFHGVIVAAILGFVASAVFAALTPFVGTGAVLRLLIPALALAYVLYLLSRSRARVGRVTVVAAWCVLTAVTWWFAPPLPLYLLVHAGAVWLVRSLYFYSSVLSASMDLGLSALGVCAAAWAVSRTGSVFLATWCFFLVQALFVAIPAALHRKGAAPADTGDENFERARRQADRALHQLFTQ